MTIKNWRFETVTEFLFWMEEYHVTDRLRIGFEGLYKIWSVKVNEKEVLCYVR